MNKYVQDFPVIKNNITYLDSSSTTLKPKIVIEKMNEYYYNYGVNVHRGVYNLSYKASDEYEKTRETVRDFINASDTKEIIYTRGASNSLNMVTKMLSPFLKSGDEVIVSALEHHSNLLPWMNIVKKYGAKIVYVPLTDDGKITIDNFKKVLNSKTRYVALTYVSNTMGYVTPLKEIINLAHENNVLVSVDAAQAVGHRKVDVKNLDCDFLSFSGHKMLGPTGIGILYGKLNLLRKLDPVEYGGDMVDTVYDDYAEYKDTPQKFETGTMPIAEVIGLRYAIEYLNKISISKIEKHDMELFNYAISKLVKIDGVSVYNKNAEAPIINFNIDGVHPHDAASIFDKNDVCLRAGHHCAQLVTKFLKVDSTLRCSIYLYNTKEDIDKFIDSVIESRDYFNQF